MDIAFSVYGWLLVGLAFATFYAAQKKRHLMHRNFAIRLWSQGIASLMYRLWYTVAQLLGYRFSTSLDFHRPLDEFMDWWFFVPNLVVAELVIFFLSVGQSKPTGNYGEDVLFEGTAGLVTPILGHKSIDTNDGDTM